MSTEAQLHQYMMGNRAILNTRFIPWRARTMLWMIATLQSHEEYGQWFKMSVKNLSSWLECSPNTVIKTIAGLIESDYLEADLSNKTSAYRILYDNLEWYGTL